LPKKVMTGSRPQGGGGPGIVLDLDAGAAVLPKAAMRACFHVSFLAWLKKSMSWRSSRASRPRCSRPERVEALGQADLVGEEN